MSKNKKIIIVLIIIILLQVIYKIYIDYHKEDFFVDELYSYGLMNYKQAFIFEEDTFINNWHTKDYFDDYLIVSKDEASDFSPVYNNQTEDYHPPFYYLLLRIASSFTIGSFTKWTGLILNIIIFIFCAITLFLIGKKIFKNNFYSILLVLCYGFSKFSTENTLFIRMYQLLELQMLLISYWGIKNYYKKSLNFKNIISLIILVVLGTLTQYYYLLFFIGICIVYIVKYIKKKQFKNLIKFILAIIIAQALVCMIFPKYSTQLFSNSKRSSSDEVNYAEKIEDMSTKESEYLGILNENMFGFEIKYLIYLMIIAGIILLVVNLIRNPKQKVRFKINKRILIIIVPTIIYWLLVSLTSPYTDLRYILPIFVFIFIIIMYLLKKEVQMIIKNKTIVMTCILIICLIYTASFLIPTELKYQYTSSKEKIENISKYKNIPCIYMYAHTDVLTNTFIMNLNYVRQFENVYIMEKINFSVADVEKALEGIDISNGIILMDNEIDAENKAQKIVDGMDEFNNYEKIEEITVERTIDQYVYWIY